MGPRCVRAAAKNHASVAIVCDPDDYPAVLAQLDEHGHIPLEMRRTLALKAFRRTAAYDAAISSELAARWTPDDTMPATLPLTLRRTLPLRYGENPHQQAALYAHRRRRTLPAAPSSRAPSPSRESPSRTTTCSMRRPPRRWPATCADTPWSS